VSANVGMTPISATPVPATNGPTGMSQGRVSRSESAPNSGWTSEEPMVAASTSIPAAA